MLHGLALPLALAAPFETSIQPPPDPVKARLKSAGYWEKGCPVPLSSLRLLTVSHGLHFTIGCATTTGPARRAAT